VRTTAAAVGTAKPRASNRAKRARASCRSSRSRACGPFLLVPSNPNPAARARGLVAAGRPVRPNLVPGGVLQRAVDRVAGPRPGEPPRLRTRLRAAGPVGDGRSASPRAAVGADARLLLERRAQGRAGLQPLPAWLDYVKLNVLPRRARSRTELGVGTVWNWGWGVYSQAGQDGDKPAAACVALWGARPRTLCDVSALGFRRVADRWADRPGGRGAPSGRRGRRRSRFAAAARPDRRRDVGGARLAAPAGPPGRRRRWGARGRARGGAADRGGALSRASAPFYNALRSRRRGP